MGSLKSLLRRFPFLYRWLQLIAKQFRNTRRPYPKSEGEELKSVGKLLNSGNWNSSYIPQGYNYQLEKAFSEYIGSEYAITVNTGGMALQMIFRAIGLKPGDEVIHQVDTCVATAFAVMNSFATPVFADIDKKTLMASRTGILKNVNTRTKVLLPVHIWGNPGNMDELGEISKEKNLMIVEDSCLALGAEWKGKKVGTFGIAGAFSFGCLKPVQAGEGGMIVTDDAALAKELRILKDWGDTTQQLGYRDQKTLAWNGRMSEFIAAIALGQLKKYPDHLLSLREQADYFKEYLLKRSSGIKVISYPESAYTQVVLMIEPGVLKKSKSEILSLLRQEGISARNANFEPINSISFYKIGAWKDWILKGDIDFLMSNYSDNYPVSNEVYESLGIGIDKMHFLTRKDVNVLIKKFDKILTS